MKEIGVIFDMDGVIIDSEPVHTSLNQEIFKQLGIRVNNDIQLEYIGVTKWRKWEILKRHFHLQESIDELIEIQNSIFSQANWDYKSLLFPDVIPLLQKLQSSNIPIALASSSERDKVDKVLEQCGLKGFFTNTVTGDEVVNGKPDPEIFLAAAKKINLSSKHCIVVEDSYNGLKAAKRANMYGIGVKHLDNKVDLSIADKIVRSLADIELEIFKR